MEAKHEEIIALLNAEMPFPQIMKKDVMSLSTIYRVKNIKSWIDRNPIKSMRRAKDHNVSEATVKRVVKKNFGARWLAKTKKFLLTECLKALSLECFKKLLQMLKKKMAIFLFSDKKYFTVSSPRRLPRKPLMPSNQSKSLSILHRLWFLDSLPFQEKRWCLLFLRQLKDLKAHTLPWIVAIFPDPEEVLFVQDDIPCHKTVQT